MNRVEHLKSLYAAFGEGDMETVLGAMHPQIKWNEAEGNPYSLPSDEPFVGPNEVLTKLFARLAEEWEDFVVSPQSYYDAGESVIIEGRYTGLYKETGKSQDSPFCHVWHFDGDKISRFQQYTNTAALQEVMGVAAAI
jgi:ketosteroid isomerase-like protein